MTKKVKAIIAVDLDGLLADYTTWQGDVFLIKEPLPGAVKFVEHLLAEDFIVCVHTVRTNTIVNTPQAHGMHQYEGREAHRWHRKLVGSVESWLDQWGFPRRSPDFYVHTEPGRPKCFLEIGPRCMICIPELHKDAEPSWYELAAKGASIWRAGIPNRERGLAALGKEFGPEFNRKTPGKMPSDVREAFKQRGFNTDEIDVIERVAEGTLVIVNELRDLLAEGAAWQGKHDPENTMLEKWKRIDKLFLQLDIGLADRDMLKAEVQIQTARLAAIDKLVAKCDLGTGIIKIERSDWAKARKASPGSD